MPGGAERAARTRSGLSCGLRFPPHWMDMMKKLLLALLPLALAGAADAQSPGGDRQSQQEEAYNTYFRCINIYAGRYVKSEALVADIADAAMSACQDRYQDLVNTTTALLGGLPAANIMLRDTRDTARSFAVRTVLEARFPLR
jgi:predicted AAA+ superfamily ATPase